MTLGQGSQCQRRESICLGYYLDGVSLPEFLFKGGEVEVEHFFFDFGIDSFHDVDFLHELLLDKSS